MYEVRDWNEEVMKWMAVGMCLVMVGMALMPVGIGDAWSAAWTWAKGGSREEIIDSAVSGALSALVFSYLYYGWTCTPVSLGAVAASVAFSA